MTRQTPPIQERNGPPITSVEPYAMSTTTWDQPPQTGA